MGKFSTRERGKGKAGTNMVSLTSPCEKEISFLFLNRFKS